VTATEPMRLRATSYSYMTRVWKHGLASSALCFVMLLGACASTTESRGQANGHKKTPSPVTCSFPLYRPTYLPWIAPGESVPDPTKDLTSGGGPQGLDPGYAMLVWAFGDISTLGGPELKGTLALWRSTENVGSFPIDPHVPSLPDGSDGRFYEGETGDRSIVWSDASENTYDDSCSETALVLTMPNLTNEEQRQELVKIARSLVSQSG
jgi:hypothetical protein